MPDQRSISNRPHVIAKIGAHTSVNYFTHDLHSPRFVSFQWQKSAFLSEAKADKYDIFIKKWSGLLLNEGHFLIQWYDRRMYLGKVSAWLKKRKSIFFRILQPTSYGKGGVSFHISFLLYFFLQWYLKRVLPVFFIDQKLPRLVGKAALPSVLYIFPAFIKSRLSLKTRQLLIQGGNWKKSLCSITGWKKKKKP